MDNLAPVGDPPEQGTNPPDMEREVNPPVVASPPARPEPPPLAFYRRGTHLIKKRPGHGVRKGPRTLPPTPAEEEQVARLAAAGIAKMHIQKSLRLSQEMVNTILGMPHVQEFMQQVREATRAITLAGIQQTQVKAMDWLEQTVDAKDARAFDVVSRGVLSLEKTAASASGESRPNVQVAVINQQTESAEVQALIRALAQ